MSVTLLEIDTVVKLVQSLNVNHPMFVTLFGITTEDKLVQPSNLQVVLYQRLVC